MATPERRLSKDRPGRAKREESTKRNTLSGTDPALTLKTARGKPLSLTYWDLWFALVAANDTAGDLGSLAQNLAVKQNHFFFDRDSVERKRSHLRDLQNRLIAAGLSVADILAAAGDQVRTERQRARRRVYEPTEQERDWSDAMRHTPRKRRYTDALRGSWSRFPVSPAPFADEIWSRFKTTGFYGENASFGVARKLDHFLERADKLLTANRQAEAQALLRAWLTVVIELIAMADDSFGCIGDSFHQGFVTYLKIPLEATGIEDEVFFADLLKLLIWEDYGFTWNQTDGYFRKLTSAQTDWCVAFLRRQIEELGEDDLAYECEKALTLLGKVVAEQDRFEQFEDLACEMGTREWERIIRLVDRAVKKRKRALAEKIFKAALTPGPHLDFLTKKYEQLQHGKWNPDPRI